jgi:hypothetical protein
MIEKAAVLAVAAIAFFASIRDWRGAVKASLVLLVVEGAIRKWLVPGSQQFVYFGKDVLLVGAYIGFFKDGAARRYRIPAPPVLLLLLSLGMAWGALEIFNPRLPNVLVGIMGFKAYFLYVPLLIVLPACFRNDGELLAFLRRYLLIVIPVGLLAILQFRSPATSMLNSYGRGAVDEQSVITFGSSEQVRVTSTFSFITGYTSFLVAATVLLLAFLGNARWNFAKNKLHFVALAFAILGMFMTGSRGPVYTVMILFPFYWYLAIMREGDTGGTFSRAALTLASAAVAIGLFGGTAFTAFMGRATGSSDTADRIGSVYAAPWRLLPEAGIMGYGVGSTHQMAATLAPSLIPYHWLNGLNTEVETGRVMLELGAVGFVLIHLARLVLMLIAYSYALSLRTRFHRSLAIGSFLFFMAEFLGGPVFDVTCGVYYWFFGGLMMLAVRLDRDAVRAAGGAEVRAQPRTTALATAGGPNSWQSLPASRS